jgi:uncharacterized LabA/DUF88 family protein
MVEAAAMSKKAIVLVDGGFLRKLASKAHKPYNPALIEKFSLACISDDEEVLRILYYDCAPYTGTVKLPVSGADHTFAGSDAWLKELSRKDLFAVRLGVLKFRGYKPANTPMSAGPLTDNDFRPDFEQKGVDMRIGLDIASYSVNRAVDRVILISNDTDCVPAMKFCRKSGLQVAIIEAAGQRVAPELLAHSDYKRCVDWP